MSRTPLQLAGQVLSQFFDIPSLQHDVCFLVCEFPSSLSGQALMYELQVFWNRSENTLAVAIGADFDLSPIRQAGVVLQALQKTIDPLLESTCPGEGQLSCARLSNGRLMPMYQTSIECDPLEDEEIRAQFCSDFARSFCALELLSPTFGQMEGGRMPNACERATYLSFTCGLWEFLGQDDIGPQFAPTPPRLFADLDNTRRPH